MTALFSIKNRKLRALLTALFVVFLTLPNRVLAVKRLSNTAFIEMSEQQQALWIEASIAMLIHVAAGNSKEQGQCVQDWYFSDPAGKDAQILRGIIAYPDNIPSSVFLILLQTACGNL